MNHSRNFLIGLGFAGVVLAGGCYTYPDPPTATLGDSYTQRVHDQSDDLFKGIKSLTLADAQRISIINNPTYIAAYHAVSAARMRYYQAWGAYSPVLTAGMDLGAANQWNRRSKPESTLFRTDGFNTSTSLQASWLVFDGLAREFKVLGSKHSLEYQRQLEADEARTLMRSVAYAYNTVLLAIEKRRIAVEDKDFQVKSLRDTEFKYQAGAVPLSDVLNFQIQANQAEVNQIDADYQYDAAIFALAVLMGYPEGTLPKELTFPSDFKTNFVELPGIEIYLDTALANRPDLKAYREQLDVTRYQLYQTYSSYAPTINAYFQMAYGTNETRSNYYNNQTYAADEPSSWSDHDTSRQYSETPSIGYGLTADWTIFNGLIRYNKMREYQANVATAEYSVAARWFTVVGEVRTAYANYVQSVRQTRIYEKTRDLSAKQRDLVDEEYVAGNTELTRLNEAQRDLVQAETNLASAYISIQNAKAQLDAAVAVNPASYYKDPSQGPGELKLTPIPGLESDKAAAKDKSKTTPPPTPQNEPVIPGALPPDKTKLPPQPQAPAGQLPNESKIYPQFNGNSTSVKPAAAAPAVVSEPKAAAPKAASAAAPTVKAASVAAPAVKATAATEKSATATKEEKKPTGISVPPADPMKP